MQFKYTKTIGRNQFTFTGSAETHAAFFDAVTFFSSLPEVGPNGEEDLQVCARRTQAGDVYYSIVCPSAGVEYKYGQKKEPKGELFHRQEDGWTKLWTPDGSSSKKEEKTPEPAEGGGGEEKKESSSSSSDSSESGDPDDILNEFLDEDD